MIEHNNLNTSYVFMGFAFNICKEAPTPDFWVNIKHFKNYQNIPKQPGSSVIYFYLSEG